MTDKKSVAVPGANKGIKVNDRKDLSGKVALVTGASKGIGAGIAKELAARGAAVAVNYSSSREGADRVVAEIKAAGGSTTAVQGNVALAADVDRIFKETNAALGQVSILVNNAGVFALEPLEKLTEEEFHREFNINVLGLLLVTRKAVEQMGPEGGSIINISSVVSHLIRPNSVIYAATKGAVDTVTKVLALELGPKNIRVNAISPGAVDTEGVRELGLLTEAVEAFAISRTPLGRIGNPQDIALFAAFLASDDSRWVTGGVLDASGGIH